MNDIVIVGAGGFGREVAWLIEEINASSSEQKWNLVGFIDDTAEGKVMGEYQVVGNIESLEKLGCNVVLAIGDPDTKEKIYNRIKDFDIKFPNLVHPNVLMSKYNVIGEGNIICAGNIITTGVNIGSHVIINLDCTIGHDSTLGDFSTILPSCNISGFVNLINNVSVGTGSQIIQGLEVGEHTIIGAGSVVTKNIGGYKVAVGIPARVIKERR